jgi:predicted exporter
VLAITGTRRRAVAAFVLAAGVVGLVALGARPHTADAIVAIKPHDLAPLRAQESIYQLFGGRPGQWLVVTEDDSAEAAEVRADRVAEALDPLARDGTLDGFDSLASYAPAEATQRARLVARDALDLPARSADLARALADSGFDVDACRPALEALRSPSHRTTPIPVDVSSSPVRWLVSRHLRRDGDRWVAVTYVRPQGDPVKDARVLSAIALADPRSVVTGYPYLEVALRKLLTQDLPEIALVACLVVGIALRALLRRMIDVVMALSTIVVEVAGVAVLMRVLHIPWHVYDALVLPVLVGVTIDESMFLLHAARRGEDEGKSSDAIILAALEEQGPLVVATALTTTAGFAALLFCRFEGLFDLGAVGVLGVLLGLVAALVIVPAGLRLSSRT